MPVTQLYAVVGDGNVRRNMTTMNIASRPSMSTAKVIDCQSFDQFPAALGDVPADATVLIVQSLTSFLCACPDTGSIYSTIDPLLTEFSNQLREYCSRRATLLVAVSPPAYQSTPV